MSEVVTVVAVVVPLTLVVVMWLLVAAAALLERLVNRRSPTVQVPSRPRPSQELSGGPSRDALNGIDQSHTTVATPLSRSDPQPFGRQTRTLLHSDGATGYRRRTSTAKRS